MFPVPLPVNLSGKMLASRQAFQQFQTSFEQLIHQICHGPPGFLGQTLKSLVHGAIHIDGEVQLSSLLEEFASDRVRKIIFSLHFEPSGDEKNTTGRLVGQPCSFYRLRAVRILAVNCSQA